MPFHIRSIVAATTVLITAGCYHRTVVVAGSNSINSTASIGTDWRPLFDGTSLAAWRGYRSPDVPNGWEIENGVLIKHGGVGDLMTRKEYGNFELELEWRIGARGNSGIFYRATQEYDHIYWSGIEYQLEDNIGADDNKAADRWTASAYAVYPVSGGQVATADRWNKTRIIVNGAHVEHWLNGQLVLTYELWSPDWQRRVAASKFSAYPNYGLARRGFIGIQGDHPGTLELRNIRIRELP